MKLDDSRRSDNVEDDRGGGGGIRGIHLGLGGTLAVIVIGYFMGVSPSTLLSLLSGGEPRAVTPTAPADRAPGNDPQVDFVRAILGETEDVWGAYFRNMERTYIRPKLVLFSGQVASACGFASSAAGPFYCPGDQKVYIDLSFYRQLATEFGAHRRESCIRRHGAAGGLLRRSVGRAGQQCAQNPRARRFGAGTDGRVVRGR